jgi:hypothetical protein
MIKSLYQITLKDIIILDATKSASHLKKYWFIPIYFLRPQLEKLATEIFKGIGGSTIADLEKDFAKLLSYRRIQILEALYKCVKIEIELKGKISVWKIILNKDYKESEQLEKVLKEVKEHTGIDIKTPEDIISFGEYIELKIDRHKENYAEVKPDEKQKEVKLSRIIYSVFNYMAEPYSENMRLITFIELKDMAEERIQTAQTKEDNG